MHESIADRAAFLDAQLVDDATRREPRELPRMSHTPRGAPITYFGGTDVSGGRHDAAGAAVAHRDGIRIIVDAVRRWPAPHDPAHVAVRMAGFFAGYGLKTARADGYGAELSRTIYAAAGMTLIAAPDNRSDTYLRMLPLFTTGRIEIPADPQLRQELLSLERRTRSGGRDVVDHRPGSFDDCANSAALAAVAAAARDPSLRVVTATFSDLALQRVAEFGRTFEPY